MCVVSQALVCAARVAQAEGRPEASARHALAALDVLADATTSGGRADDKWRGRERDLLEALSALFESGIVGLESSSRPPAPADDDLLASTNTSRVTRHAPSLSLTLPLSGTNT